MSTVLVGSLPLGGFNVGLAAGLSLMGPLLVQLDLVLAGPFGLGSLLADLSLQLSAALSVQAQLGLQITFPSLALKAQLSALISIQASIAAALALGLSVDVSGGFSISLSASLSLSAAFALRVGGIQLLIKAVLAVKLPAVDFLASIDLNAGPFVIIGVGTASPSTLRSSIVEYEALVTNGIEGILPDDQVYGVMVLTKDPQAAVSLAAVLRTA